MQGKFRYNYWRFTEISVLENFCTNLATKKGKSREKP